MRGNVHGEDAVLRSSSFVDTTFGEVMTSDNVMALFTAHASRKQAIKAAAQADAEAHEV